MCMIWKLVADKIQKYDSVMEMVNYLSWIVVICYYTVVLLEMNVELIKDNRWLMFCSLVVWSGMAVHNVLEYYKNELLIKPVDKIATESEAIAYIRLLYRVFDKKKETGNSLLFLGLVKAHINDCTDSSCICKSKFKLSNSSSS